MSESPKNISIVSNLENLLTQATPHPFDQINNDRTKLELIANGSLKPVFTSTQLKKIREYVEQDAVVVQLEENLALQSQPHPKLNEKTKPKKLIGEILKDTLQWTGLDAINEKHNQEIQLKLQEVKNIKPTKETLKDSLKSNFVRALKDTRAVIKRDELIPPIPSKIDKDVFKL
jgi:hypothetical protein